MQCDWNRSSHLLNSPNSDNSYDVKNIQTDESNESYETLSRKSSFTKSFKKKQVQYVLSIQPIVKQNENIKPHVALPMIAPNHLNVTSPIVNEKPHIVLPIIAHKPVTQPKEEKNYEANLIDMSNINAIVEQKPINTPNSIIKDNCETRLMHALRTNPDFGIVHQILKDGSRINFTNKIGESVWTQIYNTQDDANMVSIFMLIATFTHIRILEGHKVTKMQIDTKLALYRALINKKYFLAYYLENYLNFGAMTIEDVNNLSSPKESKVRRYKDIDENPIQILIRKNYELLLEYNTYIKKHNIKLITCINFITMRLTEYLSIQKS